MSQQAFQWGGGGYRHHITTTHDSASAAGNTLNFYLWKYGTDASTALGTQQVMTLRGDGNVGIGTAVPYRKLHVASGQQPFMLTTSDYNNSNTGSTLVAEFGAATGNTYAMLGALSAGGSAWNNLILQPGGNVGIGTASPVAKLQVAGTVSASDAVQVGNSSLTCAAAIAGAIEYESGSLRYCNGSAWTAVSTGTALTDGDKGDITVASSGAAWSIDTGAVTSSDIADGAIVNADVNASAAIDGTKISPNFGTQRVVTTGGLNASQGMATATGSLGAFEAQSQGSGGTAGAAFLAFHRPSAYGAYLGLDTDSQFKVGGWSMGAAAYKLWHEGNDGAGSTLDADTVDGLSSASLMDNLGNHTATQAVNMGGYWLHSGTASTGLLINNGYLRADTTDASYDLWIEGGTGSPRQLAILGVDNDSGDTLYVNHASEYAAGTIIGGPVNITAATTVQGHITTTSGITMNNGSPTMYFQDTDHYSAMIHNNSNLLYILSGCGVNTTGWCQNANSYWPFYINMTDNNAVFGGNVYAFGYYHNSDARLKKDVHDIPSALDIIGRLRGVTFTWKDSGKKSAGLIAQEVEKVMPEAVEVNGNGHMSVDYDQIVGPLIEAVKELKADNDNLRSELNNLKHELKSLQ